jgi:hypothetical protein
VSAYVEGGEQACGDPHPVNGKPCLLPPNHWAERPYHARPEPDGFDVWHPVDADL